MKKNNKRTTQHRPKNPRSKIASETIFILLGTLGVVFLISLLTSSPDEDPWTGGAVLVKPVVNSAGIFGAYLSDISIGILGYVSYILPISLLWLGYSFHRDALKEKQNQLTFLLRLIAYFVMVFFTAALAHQYAPEIKVIEGLKETFLAGGMIGKSMHEVVFYALFGEASTIIYVAIILVSFCIATSASWKNISKTMFSNNKTSNTLLKSQTAPIKPSPNISNVQKLKPKEKAIKSKDTKKTKKADKAEKPQKA